jgi:hypothetical protein
VGLHGACVGLHSGRRGRHAGAGGSSSTPCRLPPTPYPLLQPLPADIAARAAAASAPPPAAQSAAAIAAHLTTAFGLPPDAANAAALKFAASDPSLYASLWSNDADQAMLESLLQQATHSAGGGSGGGGGGPAAAAAAAAAGRVVPNGMLLYDYEFCGVELLKPTRMNKAYLVFACSVLEQDLLFVVYNIPTVGICRAEQRVKACQKLGINYADLAHVEHMYVPPAVAQTAGVHGPTGRAAAAAAMEDDSDGDASGGLGGARRKRTASQQAAAGGDALIGAEGLGHAAQHAAPDGGRGAAAAAAAAQQQMLDAMLNMAGAPALPGLGGGMPGLPGLGAGMAGLPGMPPGALGGPLGGPLGGALGGPLAGPLGAPLGGPLGGAPGFGAGFPPASAALALAPGAAAGLDVQPMGSLNVEAMLAEMDGMINAAAAAAAAGANGAAGAWPGAAAAALPHSRMALRGGWRRRGEGAEGWARSWRGRLHPAPPLPPRHPNTSLTPPPC